MGFCKLKEKMGMSKEREHIERIRKEKFWLDEEGQSSKQNPLIDDLSNSIERLSKSLYSKDTHFIFELIQNAEDNEYYKGTEPSITFRLVKADPTNTLNSVGALIVQNNEIGFSPDNVDAICAIGKTTKSKLQGYIGEKGIGFKSVFRITTIPHIFSNGYQFCFPEKNEKTSLGYIVPRWIKNIPHGVDPKQTTIILPLDKPDFGYEKIEGMLQDIEPETILFLSKLKEIRIRTGDGDDLTILKDGSKAPHIQLLIKGTKQGASYSEVKEFLLFTQTVDRPKDVSHEKRADINERDVIVAFPVDDNKDNMGKIFAYLPVRSNTGLPFLINADFILPSSREDIQDVPWNRWLMKCVANLVADKLPLLKEKNLLTVELLEAFAKRMNEINEYSIFYPIIEALHDAFKDQELLPTDDGTFVSARNAKLARGAELRKLLSPNQLQELFSSKETVKWLSGEITQDRTPDLRSYLINKLNVEEITPDGFARKTTAAFLKNQSDEWMIAFYRFLNGQEALWKKGNGSWSIPNGPLRNKSFIRLENGSHVKPFNDNDMPNAYLPSENDTEFPVVSRKISKDKKALEFLKKLGLTKPDAVAEVIEFVLPKYRQSNPDISDDEHRQDIKKILKAYETNSRENKSELMKKLKETAFIRAENIVLQQIEYKKAERLYFKNEELSVYFKGNKDAWFISSKYNEKFKEMFKELGVHEEFNIQKTEKSQIMSIFRDYHDIDLGYQKGNYWKGLKSFDPNIQIEGIQYAIKNPLFERSKIIWNEIAVKYSHCIKGKILKSSRQDFSPNASVYEEEELTSDFGNLLIENPWLPNKHGNFHKPAELKLEDLPESFVCDEKLANQLGMKKDVVAKLAEEVGISMDDIDLINRLKEYPKEYEKVKAILAKKEKPEFPSSSSANPERRKEKVVEQIDDAPEKEYKKRNRSVLTTANTIDKETYLRMAYTNNNDQMICQICKEEMPFKKRNGKYYFEAVEALSRDYFTKEHEAQFIALCPVCAAMYKEFVKNDEDAMESLKNELINSEDVEIPIKLGKRYTSIRFVETHFQDIKTILKEQK